MHHFMLILFLYHSDVHFAQCWRQDKKRLWVESVQFSVVMMLGDARGALETRPTGLIPVAGNLARHPM